MIKYIPDTEIKMESNEAVAHREEGGGEKAFICTARRGSEIRPGSTQNKGSVGMRLLHGHLSYHLG